MILGLTKEQIAALPDGLLGLERTASQAELAAWYSAADCFVNPTISDTMPLVNLEALACGTPIAVFNTGGCPEVITDTCGIVAEKGNAKALADAVKAHLRSRHRLYRRVRCAGTALQHSKYGARVPCPVS